MFLRYGGLSLVTFTKNKGANRAIWATKYKTSVAGKYTRAGAPLAQTYTLIEYSSQKKGTTSMKKVN